MGVPSTLEYAESSVSVCSSATSPFSKRHVQFKASNPISRDGKYHDNFLRMELHLNGIDLGKARAVVP